MIGECKDEQGKAVDEWEAQEIRSWKGFEKWLDTLDRKPCAPLKATVGKTDLPLRNPRVFRGQSDSSWPLRSSFQRLMEGRCERLSHEELLATEQHMRRSFQRSANAHFRNLPRTEETEEWMALMQHYGVATRLLDWTESPFVALYFALEGMAFREKGSRHGSNKESCLSCAVYALDPNPFIEVSLRKSLDARIAEEYMKMAQSKQAGRFDGVFKSKDPAILHMRPFFKNQRLTAQQGLFLAQSNICQDFSQTVTDLVRIQPDLAESWKKVAIKLNKERRIEFFKKLREMNVTAAGLRPDFDGYCREINVLGMVEDPAEWPI